MGKPAAERSMHGNVLADGTHELVPLAEVVPSKWNPRGELLESDPKFQALVESVRASGVRIPVCVRPHPESPRKWELLYGSRRRAAALLAGLKKIPALVRTGLTDEEAFEITWAENFGREDLTPLEQARAVAILLEKYLGDYAAVASRLGWSVQRVARRAHLTKLSDAWRLELGGEGSKFGGWTPAHLELIARYEEEEQDRLLEKWLKVGAWTWLAEASVADVNAHLCAEFRELAKAPFLPKGTLDGCAECMKRTGAKPSLFDLSDVEGAEKPDGKDRCTDPKCWDAKLKAWLRRREKEEARKIEGEGADNATILRISTAGYGGRGVLGSGGYDAAKKADKGAVPALVVDGSGLGKLKYVKPKKGAVEGMAPATMREPPHETPKQARERIERERLDFVRGSLDALLGGSSRGGLPKKCRAMHDDKHVCKVPAPSLEVLAVLAGAIGADAPTDWQRCDVKRLAAARALAEDDLRALLWCAVRKFFVDIQSPDADAWPDFCELVGIDYADLERQAREKFPDPETAEASHHGDTEGTEDGGKQADGGKPKKKRKTKPPAAACDGDGSCDLCPSEDCAKRKDGKA